MDKAGYPYETEEEAYPTCLKWGNRKNFFQLSIADDKGNILIIDVRTGRQIKEIKAAQTWINTLDIEPAENKLLAVGTMNARILLYEINKDDKKSKGKHMEEEDQKDDQSVYKLVGHNGGVLCCKFLSDKYLISGGSDAAVCVWDLENSHKYLSMYTEHNSDCVSMNAYKEDSNIFVTGSSDLTAKIWDIRIKDPV